MKKKEWIVIAALFFSILTGIQQSGREAVLADQTAPAAETSMQKSLVMAPSGISKDRNGRLYIADRSYHVLRRRNQSGNYVVLAGQMGKSGYKDGSATKALFHSPWDTVSYKKGRAMEELLKIKL